MKKIILSAGGTGGHLFPAQSLAAACPDLEILFVAGGLQNNAYFDQESFAFEEIECATFSFSKPKDVLKGGIKILKGVRSSQKIISRFQPDLVVGFGSFFTLPILAAAVFEKIPLILHEQNAIPGKVNRLFSHFANITAITFPVTCQYLTKKARQRSREVLFPLRKKEESTKEEILNYFGLTAHARTLLVFGGSQGAERLNALFFAALKSLSNVQVLHFTGNEQRAARMRHLYAEQNRVAYVKAFEERMDLAMQIADLAVVRAGAATIAELIEYELPALLIPYPFATDNHQESNGAHFVSQVKGGTMYKEKDLDSNLMATVIEKQLACLCDLKKNILEYKRGRQAVQLHDLIEGILHE